MRADLPAHWSRYLADQDDVISRAQALSGAMTAEAWEWRLRRGVWQRALPGVAVAHSGTLTARQQWWAAVLHAGPGAALSGDAALVASGFAGLRLTVLDLVVPPHRRVVAAPLAGGLPVAVHRVRAAAGWVRPDDGLPVVGPHAAVLHAAAWATSDRAAEWRVAACVQQKLTAVVLLRGALAQMPRLPRRALLLDVLDDVELGAHAGSELDFLRFCRRHRLPLPDEMQVRVRAAGVRYLDARWRRQRLSLELDGAHHREVRQWEQDALRSLSLAVVARRTGEQLVRLTRGNLRHDGRLVAEQLRALLR